MDLDKILFQGKTITDLTKHYKQISEQAFNMKPTSVLLVAYIPTKDFMNAACIGLDNLEVVEAVVTEGTKEQESIHNSMVLNTAEQFLERHPSELVRPADIWMILTSKTTVIMATEIEELAKKLGEKILPLYTEAKKNEESE